MAPLVPAASAEFDTQWARAVDVESNWCCFTCELAGSCTCPCVPLLARAALNALPARRLPAGAGGDSDADYRLLIYPKPPPLGGEWRAWETPELALPEWCDEVSATDGNSQFTKLPQHPCAFLRDAGAWEHAARGTY